MDIKNIARTMRARMPWDTARRVFDFGKVEKAHGWDNTLRKIEDDYSDNEAVTQTLSAALADHVLCGEKLTSFHRLTKKQMAELSDAASRLRPKSTPFRESYPAAIDQKMIDETFPEDPTLVAVEKREDGIGVVYASTRAIQVREPIDISAIPDDAGDLLDGYDEVVGIKLKKYQAMDVVWIPHSGSYIDIRVDFPKGMHRDTGVATQEAIKRLFARAVDIELPASPANLYPIIRKIYDDQDEGDVVELAFGTTTASLKHEKMRRGGLCLRDEIYHRGGKRALGSPINPHRISVRWEVGLGGVKSFPELSLNGGTRMAGSAAPTLYDAHIEGCMGVADYEFVRERIEYYLKL